MPRTRPIQAPIAILGINKPAGTWRHKFYVLLIKGGCKYLSTKKTSTFRVKSWRSNSPIFVHNKIKNKQINNKLAQEGRGKVTW